MDIVPILKQEQLGRPEQRRRVRQQRKAEMVASRFVVAYTPAEVRALTPVRDSVEKRAPVPDLRDVFLCHAWDDRRGVARELPDLLESLGASVWFSDKDVALRCSAKLNGDRRSRESGSCW